jgi:hypothetical protein
MRELFGSCGSQIHGSRRCRRHLCRLHSLLHLLLHKWSEQSLRLWTQRRNAHTETITATGSSCREQAHRQASR